MIEGQPSQLPIDEIVSRINDLANRYPHLRNHWEFSRSGCALQFELPQSNSQYLHVEGDGEDVTFRVSDHKAPSNRVPDYELLAGCAQAEADAVLEDFAGTLDLMESYDAQASEQAMISKWKLDADNALSDESQDDLRSEIQTLVDYYFQDGFRSLAETLSEEANIILRESDDDDWQQQEDVLTRWKNMIVEVNLILIGGMDDGLRYYKALKFVCGDDDTRLLDERSAYGNGAAHDELRRCCWIKGYLCQQLNVQSIPADEYGLDNWLRECMVLAIKEIFVEDLEEELQATIQM
jgi:hypothetical protein